ncbi:tyrosine-type recombinase/integrase [Oligella urethralis]|uniref:tyrosine-type recombinase/integrase n=1 Tax=Oligella urethralis TaxID=90245 RepID=UPI00065FC7D8|nr:site-specific integrase [Oligella urethralis]
MAINLLTDRKVANAKSKEREYLLHDGNGLYLRVRPTGSKSWTVKVGNTKKSIGRYPAMSLAQARSVFEKMVSVGSDKTMTVDGLFHRWYEDYALPNRSDLATIRSNYKSTLMNEVGHIPLEQLTRKDLMAAFDKKILSGTPQAAAASFTLFGQILKWGYTREFITHLPLYGLTLKDLGVKRSEGERFLSPNEVPVVIQSMIMAVNARKHWTTHAVACLFALATGARTIEVVKARKEDIDLESGTWKIQGSISKNGLEHIVHLNALSRHLLKGIQHVTSAGGYLFYNRNKKDPNSLHLDSPGLLRFIKRLFSEHLLPEGFERFTAHDLRRTVGTLMGELGIEGEVIDLCLNHREKNKVKRTYQKQLRLDDRRQAFERYGDYIVSLLGNLDSLPTLESLRYPTTNVDQHV